MDVEQARSQLDRLLELLGHEMGIPDLATDENGVCILVFEGQLHINMMVDPSTANLLAWSTIGALPESGAEAVLRQLMRANLFWRQTDGGTLGLMPDSDMIVFALQRPMEGVDVPLLRALIETVVLRAEYFLAVLQDPGRPAAAPPKMART